MFNEQKTKKECLIKGRDNIHLLTEADRNHNVQEFQEKQEFENSIVPQLQNIANEFKHQFGTFDENIKTPIKFKKVKDYQTHQPHHGEPQYDVPKRQWLLKGFLIQGFPNWWARPHLRVRGFSMWARDFEKYSNF